MSDQLSLGALSPVPDRPPTPRERQFAEWLAGWFYPGRGGFDKLQKPEREACIDAAMAAHEIATRAQ